MSDVGQRVARLRRAKGWTQQQLANAAHLHSVTVSNIEQGRRRMGADAAVALARALGVTVDELLTGSVPTTLPDP
jgi:transcriptional regulator with XRE-family HTH domain